MQTNNLPFLKQSNIFSETTVSVFRQGYSYLSPAKINHCTAFPLTSKTEKMSVSHKVLNLTICKSCRLFKVLKELLVTIMLPLFSAQIDYTR